MLVASTRHQAGNYRVGDTERFADAIEFATPVGQREIDGQGNRDSVQDQRYRNRCYSRGWLVGPEQRQRLERLPINGLPTLDPSHLGPRVFQRFAIEDGFGNQTHLIDIEVLEYRQHSCYGLEIDACVSPDQHIDIRISRSNALETRLQ